MFKIDKAINCEVKIVDNDVYLTYKNVRDCGCKTDFVFTNGKQYEIKFNFQTNNSNNFCRNISINTEKNDLSYDTKLCNFMGKKEGQNQHVTLTTQTIPNDGQKYVLFLNGNNFASGATGYSNFLDFSIKEIGNENDLLDDKEEPENKEENDTNVPENEPENKEENDNKDNTIEQLKEMLSAKEKELEEKNLKIKEMEEQIKELEEKLKQNSNNSNNDSNNEVNDSELATLTQMVEELENMLYQAQHDLSVLKHNI